MFICGSANSGGCHSRAECCAQTKAEVKRNLRDLKPVLPLDMIIAGLQNSPGGP